MRNVANALDAAGVKVDILILVDANCYLQFVADWPVFQGQHSDETETIPTNVRKVFNSRQDTGNDGRSGFRVSLSGQTQGHETVVNKYGGFRNAQLCASDVGHNSIDESPALLEYIGKIVSAELRGGDLTPVLNLLLQDSRAVRDHSRTREQCIA